MPIQSIYLREETYERLLEKVNELKKKRKNITIAKLISEIVEREVERWREPDLRR